MEKISIFKDGMKIAEGEGKVSFINSKRLRNRQAAVTKKIAEAAEHEARLNHFDPHEKQLIDDITKRQRQQINKMVFDLAERNGVSIWDICMNYMPELSVPDITPRNGRMEWTQNLRLVPLPLELEKGGGYWKSKYYRLKEKLQELINNKED